MKLRLIILVILTALVCSSCMWTAAPQNSPEPVLKPELPPVTIDSKLVGQWIPLGAQTSGYLQFTEDGQMIFAVEQEGKLDYREMNYRMESESVYRTIYPYEGTEDKLMRFEISEDNTELTVYGEGDFMGSVFYRLN